MPNNPRAGGISRRIEGDERSEMREIISSLEIPDGMGIIVRTAGVGKQQEELQWDFDYLLSLWNAVTEASAEHKAPFLIYQESNVIIRTIRDYLRQDIGEVLFDTEESYNEAINFVRQVMPHYESRIKLYQDPLPLFNRYQIEAQIESAFQREVKLPSGGSIVIDPTEALISIDINSSWVIRGVDIEEMALNTNLEAAEEIVRQLRLRDMGGLVVIDFIDMSSNKNQKDVENRMREALEADRARVQVGRISRFGLMEMSRQRLRPSLEETNAIVCPRCNGQGSIRDIKSLCLSILRVLQEEANKRRSAEIRAIVPLNVAAYLLNEKRKTVSDIEQQSNTRLLIIPNPAMETPHYEIQNISVQDAGAVQTASYDVEVGSDSTVDTPPPRAAAPAAQPVVRAPAITQAPAPAPRPQGSKAQAPGAQASQTGEPQQVERKKGLLGSLISVFTGLVSGAANDEASSQEKRDSQSAAQGENKSRGDERRQPRGGQGRSRRKPGDGEQPERRESRQERSAGKPEEASERSRSKSTEQGGGRGEESARSGERPARKRRGGRSGQEPQRQDSPRQDSPQQEEQRPARAEQSSRQQAEPADSSQDESNTEERSTRRRRGRKPRNTAQRTRGALPEQSATEGGGDEQGVDAAQRDKAQPDDTQAVTAAQQQQPVTGDTAEKAAETAETQERRPANKTSNDESTEDNAANAEGSADDSTQDAEKPRSRRSRGSRGGRSRRKSGASREDSDVATTDDAEATVADKAPKPAPAEDTGEQTPGAGAATDADAAVTAQEKAQEKVQEKARENVQEEAIKPAPASTEDTPAADAGAQTQDGDDADSKPAPKRKPRPRRKPAKTSDKSADDSTTATDSTDANVKAGDTSEGADPAKQKSADTAELESAASEKPRKKATRTRKKKPAVSEEAAQQGESKGESKADSPSAAKRGETPADVKSDNTDKPAGKTEPKSTADKETGGAAAATASTPAAARETAKASDSNGDNKTVTPAKAGRAPNDPREIRRRQKEQEAARQAAAASKDD
jgi:ribonuclease E